MQKKYILTLFIIFAAIGVLLFVGQKDKFTNTYSSVNTLEPAQSITHGHGLAIDTENINMLYIATHHGLLVLKNDKDLYSVGQSRNDYMGFSKHPTNSKVFFSSGHPQTGGNMGFLKSEDGGFTWKKISDGIGGPVDFHAMVVSPSNPDIVYGWYQGNLQKTTNGGETWEAYPVDFLVTSLNIDPQDADIVYATTPQDNGIMKSTDSGESWVPLSDQFKGVIVSTMVINPSNSNQMLAFSGSIGLQKSEDGGITWGRIDEAFGGEEVLHAAIANQNPKITYALTHKNSLYKSSDGGETWKKIR